jgi:hypothetical protein
MEQVRSIDESVDYDRESNRVKSKRHNVSLAGRWQRRLRLRPPARLVRFTLADLMPAVAIDVGGFCHRFAR